MKRFNTISTICLLSGLAVPAVFWSTIFICAKRFDSYSHISRMVSELGELGTVTQRAFTYGLVACAALSLLLISTLIILAKRYNFSVLPVIIMSTFSFSIWCAGIFPYPTQLHGTLGTPALVMFLSPLLAIVLWRSSDRPRAIVPFAFMALILMLSGLSTFFPDFLPDAFGLKQRVFHLGWSIWFVYLGVTFFIKSKASLSSMASQHA